MSKHLHTARAAEAGVLAALLAEQGFTGPEAILEGEKGFYAGLCPDPIPEAVTADSGRAWELTRTSIKPWPCCRHTHPAIDAALSLHGALGRAALARVRVGTYRAALDVCDRPRPEDPYSAKFSLQHCVAAALVDGAVAQSNFGSDARTRLAEARSKVEVAAAPAIDAAYPAAWGAEVIVETADGRKLSAIRREAKGDPENPVAADELSAKANALLLEGGLSDQEAGKFVADVLALVEDRPVRSLALFARLAGTRLPPRLARSA
jgi:2-methylcitrate dehydratase PrpD